MIQLAQVQYLWIIAVIPLLLVVYGLYRRYGKRMLCLLYTSDAADDLLCVDLGGSRIIKKKKQTQQASPDNPHED